MIKIIIALMNDTCRSGGIRQHETGYGLSRGRLGRMRRRGRSLPGDHGGPGRERPASTTAAVAPAELPPRAPAVGRRRRAIGRAACHDVDVDLYCQQLRAAQHGLGRDATRPGNYAAPGQRRPRLGPVSGSVSPTTARETLPTLGRGAGVLISSP